MQITTGVTLALAAGTAFASVTDGIPVERVGPWVTGSVGGADFASTAENGTVTGDAAATGAERWELNGPVEVGGGTINNLSVDLTDPTISFGFDVTAGATDTTFTFTTAALAFPTISPAFGSASAGVSLTDANADGSALLSSGGAGVVDAVVNPGAFDVEVFASLLLSDLSVSSIGGTAVASDAEPAAAPPFLPISVDASSQQLSFGFTLSAGDRASGTAVFVVSDVVPSPATALLATPAGLFLLRRSRR